MDFLEKNIKIIGFGFATLIIGGLIISLASTQSDRKEKSAQENFISIQAKVNQLKAEQAKATSDAAVKENAKMINSADLKKDLEDFISKNPATIAAQIAGMSLADILSLENNKIEALNVLKKIESKSTLLSNTLVQKKIGQLLADTDQCKEAIVVWDKILANKKAEFIFSDILIKQSLCYQKMNDLNKAEELLTKVKNNKIEGQEQTSLEAEKMLRLIQFNKAQGS